MSTHINIYWKEILKSYIVMVIITSSKNIGCVAVFSDVIIFNLLTNASQ